MSKIEELRALWQAYNDHERRTAERLPARNADEQFEFECNDMEAFHNLMDFIAANDPAEVLKATLFWDAHEWDCTHDDLQDLFDGYDENEVIEVGAAVRLPNFFLVKHWPEEADERQWLTAPTREELEAEINALDAAVEPQPVPADTLADSR